MIVATATDYFVITQASKKIRKGWWSKDNKTSKDRIKRSQKKIQNKTVSFKSFTSTISQSKIPKYNQQI